jgi:hypothetical protein
MTKFYQRGLYELRPRPMERAFGCACAFWTVK